MQKGLRVITLQGAIDKSRILLTQYWKIYKKKSRGKVLFITFDDRQK